MTEMDKLVEYLEKSGANYKRIKETNIVTFPDGYDRDLGRNHRAINADEEAQRARRATQKVVRFVRFFV